MPDRKKLSQLKASRLCCDGAAGSPRDRDSTILTSGTTSARTVESASAEEIILDGTAVNEVQDAQRLVFFQTANSVVSFFGAAAFRSFM